jgi:hypothetical protein
VKVLQSLIYPLMLACLFTHELDALTQSEWRLLYVLRSLPDALARWWFVAIHVPLFAAMLYFGQHGDAVIQRRARLVIAVFCVIHAGLHWRLRADPLSSFDSGLSWALIGGAALLGALYLWLNTELELHHGTQ